MRLHGITVEEALKLPAFKGSKLIAGAKGRYNIIKYVDVMEVPDAVNWVREDEMLLTTVFAIKNDVKAQEDLIVKMAKIKASALCIKPGRFIDKIPRKMLKLAEELGLPIIELPPEVPYIDIINQVLSRILSKKASTLELINRIHTSLTDVVLEGGGLQAICRKLSKLTGYPIVILNSNNNIVAYSAERKEIYNVINHLRLMKEFENYKESRSPTTRIFEYQGERTVVTPIVIEKKIYGFLIMLGHDATTKELNIKALEQGAIVAALEFLKEKNVQEIKKRLMKDLINDLLEGNTSNPDLLRERAHYFGWDLESGMQVVVIDIEQPKNKSSREGTGSLSGFKNCFLDVIKITVKKVDPRAIVTDKSGRIVVLVNIPEECKKSLNTLYSYTKEVASDIQQEIASNLEDVNINLGIGRYYENVEGISKSYKEALEAVYLGKKILGSNKVIHFDDLGVYKILLDMHDKNQLQEFALNYLGPLIEYDKKWGTDLITTLEAYIKNDKKICKTADELFVHRNTVRYRIERINDILGVDLEDGDMLFNIYFSLKALKIVNSTNS